MSVLVCRKRSFFEEDPNSPTWVSQPVYKKHRCGLVAQLHPPQSLLDQLHALFPTMDNQFLERALQECNNDLDAAIKSLQNLNLSNDAERHPQNCNARSRTSDEDKASPCLPAQENLPGNGVEWVELFVSQMASATSLDDARSRATRLLESLEKYIKGSSVAEAEASLDKENAVLKEKIGVLLGENGILKRAVAIQHGRQKEYEDRNQEVEQLKQMVSEYQQKVRTLEVNNYALSMQLQQVLPCNNSITGRFHPDIF